MGENPLSLENFLSLAKKAWSKHYRLFCNHVTVILFCAVVYFGDDDNTYDLRLFDEIRLTKKVSVFPVGLIGYAMSTPIVQNNKSRNPGRVVGFSDPWFEKRKFPVGKNAIFT